MTALLLLLPLAWLWFRLIDHLRAEWLVNPQYTYGWAVPFLCLYLIWRKAESRKQKAEIASRTESREQKAEEPTEAESGKQEAEISSGLGPSAAPDFSFSGFQLFGFCLLAFLYLPTRLIQEANPEWRLVSWALALEVVGLTLVIVRLVSSQWSVVSGPPRHSPFRLSTFQHLRFSDLVFPICFFLVAVPWPTFVEAPVTQGLMRANVGATIELLGAMGIPAIQHGNLIELGTGMVGVDEACSGIRSLQATLMISLFLGELYALSVGRRLVCVAAGFALAFLFNVGRTTILTLTAASQGTAAIASWHDPAGVTILVWCFLLLWILALALGGSRSLTAQVSSSQSSVHSPQATVRAARTAGHRPFQLSALQGFSVFLIAWLVLVEAGTELWYRSHEWRMEKANPWHVELPRGNASFRELPFSEKTRQSLRYDEGCNGTWREEDGSRWQAISLRWDPGHIAVHLAKSHTPEVCLTATGRELVSQLGPRVFPVHGLELPFRSYVVKGERGPLYVFYCLWDDRGGNRSFSATRMTYASRLAPVLAGQRNPGQRSLEIAIWGIANQQEADAALAQELASLVKVGE